MPKTHQQQTAAPIDRELVKRLADLCRPQPAVFAAVVRHSDHLQRHGVERHEATRIAPDEAGL